MDIMALIVTYPYALELMQQIQVYVPEMAPVSLPIHVNVYLDSLTMVNVSTQFALDTIAPTLTFAHLTDIASRRTAVVVNLAGMATIVPFHFVSV